MGVADAIFLLVGYLRRVSGVVVCYLEEKESVNRVGGLQIGRRDSHPRSPFSFKKRISDLAFALCHCRDTRWCRVMDEHRQIKISDRKQFCDVRQMRANLAHAYDISDVVRLDLDFASITEEPKMVAVVSCENPIASSPRSIIGQSSPP